MDKIDTLNVMLGLIQAPVLGPDDIACDELGYDAGRNQPNPTNMAPLLLASEEQKQVWKRAHDRGLADRRNARKLTTTNV